MISPCVLLLRPSPVLLPQLSKLARLRRSYGLLSKKGASFPIKVSPFPDSRRTLFLGSGKSRELSFACSYSTKEKQKTNSTEKRSEVNWPILEKWDVPWQWQTVLLTMIACGVSFALTGLLEASALPYLGFQGGEMSLDEKAEILFVGQFTVTGVVLGVIYGITNTFRPLPDDLFRYDLKEPFNLRNGWLLWAGAGLFGALVAIALLGVGSAIFNGEKPERETDALVRLLPLIGSSGISTACLVGITGVLAPILEETVFRGFLMVSLTKWFPTPVSVVISAAVFALAHLTPGEFPQLFVLELWSYIFFFFPINLIRVPWYQIEYVWYSLLDSEDCKYTSI